MDRINKRITFIGVLFILVLFIASLFLFMPDGEALFRYERCITCHRFRGQGGNAGPDLTDVKMRRSILWIIKQVRQPQSHNPGSRMPAYEHLTYQECYAIASYLKSE